MNDKNEQKMFKDYSGNIFSNLLNNEFVKSITSKKFMQAVYILTFVFVCVIVIKTFYYKSKYFVIRSRQEEEASVYIDENVDVSKLRRSAVDDYITCISSKVDNKDLSDGVKKVINKINKYYKQSNAYFAFKYVDISTGFSVGFNEKQSIFGASTIKAPTDLYIWEMASAGKINLEDKMKYTVRYYNTGSGKLKKKKFNTYYTIKELLGYSTTDSDNAAHNMLMDKFGRKNMLNFWKEKGTKVIFTSNSNWSSTTARDSAIYMMELYRFYIEDDEYGSQVMNNFLKAHPKFISSPEGYKIANKAGWSGSAIHDNAIVFAENPYIIIALSNLGGGNYRSYFKKASELASELHTEYWKYKMEICGNIKQY